MRRTVLVTVCALFLLSAGGALGEEAAKNRMIAPPGTDLGLPFSAGVLSGDFLYLSGAIGNKPGTTEVVGDATAQTRQTLDNLETVLEAAGMDFSRVVDANVYLSDIRWFQEMSDAFAERFPDGARPPARTTVEADIAIPGALTEISMIAAAPGVEIRKIVPEGWRDGGRYSWGVEAGDSLFIAGAVSHDPKTGEPVGGDAGAQTRSAMQNVGAVLDAAGFGWEDVVSCRVYLPDARDYGAMNEVYPTFFSAEPPARATLRARLVDPRWRIEVQCRAVRGERKAVLPPGAEPRKILSPAIRVGDELFLSGMVGRGPDGYPPGVSAQTRVTLERLAATLAAAGMTFRDVREATVFLTDIRHYAAMNEIYREMVGSPPPARATVGTQLMSPDALVEIQMSAAK